jgi:hypothetical protein
MSKRTRQLEDQIRISATRISFRRPQAIANRRCERCEGIDLAAIDPDDDAGAFEQQLKTREARHEKDPLLQLAARYTKTAMTLVEEFDRARPITRWTVNIADALETIGRYCIPSHAEGPSTRDRGVATRVGRIAHHRSRGGLTAPPFDRDARRTGRFRRLTMPRRVGVHPFRFDQDGQNKNLERRPARPIQSAYKERARRFFQSAGPSE